MKHFCSALGLAVATPLGMTRCYPLSSSDRHLANLPRTTLLRMSLTRRISRGGNLLFAWNCLQLGDIH